MEITKPHAAMLASPGMGHVIPVIELDKRLAGSHGFRVTIFVIGADDVAYALSQLLISPGSDTTLINIICLPTPDISSFVDPSTHIGAKLLIIMRETVPALRSKIAEMQQKPTALIVDVSGVDALQLGGEFNMLTYVFITSNAHFLAVFMYFPTLDKDVKDDHLIKKKPLAIPGCEPVRFEDTMKSALEKGKGLLYQKANGLIVNTWHDMEPKTLKSLQDPNLLGRIIRVPIYPVGPLHKPADLSNADHPVFDWLNKQPDESVIYISFRSGGSLSTQQLTELAFGLEMSQQRFVWVVRPPIDGLAFSTYLSANSSDKRDDIHEYLPKEFASRTHERGFMLSSWAPRVEILAHKVVGGFLTHCGWNSILESVVSGVPMIAWPLFSDQMMNATLLNEELGIAIRSKKQPSEGVILRAEIEALVRRLMVEVEGCEMRKKVKKLRDTAEISTHGSLSNVADECVHLLESIKVEGTVHCVILRSNYVSFNFSTATCYP